MVALGVWLTRSLEVVLGETPITQFRSVRTKALLAYLVAESDWPHPRVALAGLLWPDARGDVALHNLSQTLTLLRQALSDRTAGPFFLVTRQTIQWNSNCDCWLDLASIVERLNRARAHARTHGSGILCTECITLLTQATSLYRGSFLADISIPDSDLFDEWVSLKREWLERQVVEALERLTTYHERQGKYGVAQQYARQLIEHDPLSEAGHRQLMRALALAGQRTAALEQYAVCRDILGQELGIEPGSETRGLEQLIRSGELTPVQQPVLATLHHLPVQSTSFVGREHELHTITAYLEQPDTRLLTIVGGGGMGKTRLAQEAVRAHVAHFPDGIVFVALAPLTLPAAIAPAIADALGLHLHADVEQAIVHFVRSKRLLLILDNFEHLLDGAPLVSRLIEVAPGLKIIVTSREPLSVHGEYLYWLDGMEYVADATLDEAEKSSAVRLFVQAARRAQPQFRLNSATIADVLKICALVQGMPLGLELAAAWTELLSLPTIVSEIEQSADFLAWEWRDVPERQRSMRAVFEWSWNLLSVAEQCTLCQFAIFRGGFTRDAAVQVTGTSMSTIRRLLQKSLLRRSGSDRSIDRYDIHELLRQFVGEKLARENELLHAVEERYVHYYLSFLAERAAQVVAPRSQAIIAQLRREIENCRNAWLTAVRRRWAHLLHIGIEGLTNYVKVTGQFADIEALLEPALAWLATDAQEATAAPAYHDLLAAVWLAYGECCYSQNKCPPAIAAAEAAVVIARITKHERHEALGLLLHGRALILCQNRMDVAKPFAQAALALAQRQGLRHLQAQALVILSYSEETLAKRVTLITTALQTFLEEGDWYFELFCTRILAGTYENDGFYTQSLAYRKLCVDLARKNGDDFHLCEALALNGHAFALLGVQARALDEVNDALAIARRWGFVRLELWCLGSLANLYYLAGDIVVAEELMHELMSIARREGDDLQQYQFMAAQMVVKQGDLPTAKAIFTRLLTEKRGHQWTPITQLLPELAELADVTERGGEHELAMTYVEEILTTLAQRPTFALRDVYNDLYRIYGVCYQVLAEHGDPRADTILEMGYNKLRAQAAEIPDAELRYSFVEQLPTNRELVRMYEARVVDNRVVEVHG